MSHRDSLQELRRSAGELALEGIDLSQIDVDAVLRQSHIDCAERVRPGTPYYPLFLILIVMTTGIWADQRLGLACAILVLLGVAFWRSLAIRWVVRGQADGPTLGPPLVTSILTMGSITGWLVYARGFETSSFLALLCSGVFVIVGSILIAMHRSLSSRFLIAGIAPIILGVGWDLDAPRATLIFFVLALAIITSKMSASFRLEYWREVLTTQLVESQKRHLETAQQLAEEAGRARDDLLRNLTHELRTPMNGVLGLLQLAQSQSDPSEKEALLHLVEDSAKEMLHQVNRVLDLQTPRVEQKLRSSLFHPRIFFEQWMQRFRANAAQKHLALKLRIHDDLPSELVLDTVRLQSIFTNLLDNAIKFTNEGRVDVFVYGVAIDDQRYRLGIAVRDTGPGIAEGMRGVIFEPYRQLDASVTRAHGGLGIGLAIVKMQTELMGGSVDVNCDGDEGSTFRVEVDVRLPQPSEPTPATPQTTEAEPAAI